MYMYYMQLKLVSGNIFPINRSRYQPKKNQPENCIVMCKPIVKKFFLWLTLQSTKQKLDFNNGT